MCHNILFKYVKFSERIIYPEYGERQNDVSSFLYTVLEHFQISPWDPYLTFSGRVELPSTS